MCKRAPILGALLLFLSLPLARAQNVSDIVGDTFEETSGSGLVIRTRPTGVKVFIDGVERGQTPFSSNALRPGDYSVRLSKEGYLDRRFGITVSGKSRVSVSIEMEEAAGQVRVIIRRAPGSPEELPLEPLIDGGAGESGATEFTLPVGLRTIRVRAFGWEEVSRTVRVREDFPAFVDVTLKPAVFKLSGGTVSRRRFNPGNPGALGKAEFSFEVSAPGSAMMRVRDQSGAEVYSRALGPFSTWQQGGTWDGRDSSGAPLPQGRYAIIITGESAGELVLETQIDYSLNIFPLALTGGIAGLLFAPVPAALPAGSFQIETALFFGSFSAPEDSDPHGGDKAFSSLPFEAGLRIAPLDRLELSAAFNMNPAFDGSAGFGFSGSAKYVFLNGAGSLPLAMAAGVSYAWAQSRGEVPLGTGRGGGLYLPMSLNLDPLSILFSPGMRWPGPDDPLPRLLLSAGVLFRRAWLAAGLSIRPEFDFAAAGDRAGLSFAQRIRVMYGAEVKFYPPPSNLVFTVSGGAWQRNGRAGGFGGIGIGLLF